MEMEEEIQTLRPPKYDLRRYAGMPLYAFIPNDWKSEVQIVPWSSSRSVPEGVVLGEGLFVRIRGAYVT